MNFKKSITLDIAGLGFIFYSPFSASDIAEGEDYLATGFENPLVVEEQALSGKIVGVSAGSSGRFVFDFHHGYPTEEMTASYEYKLRLGIQVKDRMLCIRDLYDLIGWSSECPTDQIIELDNGFYHLTLLSNPPLSGIIGDDQKIIVFLQILDEMPMLRYNGVPTLC